MSNSDRERAAREFMRELGSLAPADERLIVGFAEEVNSIDKETGELSHAGWWPRPFKEGAQLFSSRNDYVAIASGKKTLNKKTEKMRYWRNTESFGTALAFYVDDIGGGIGSKGAFSIDELSAILPPTAIVETSPGNYQAWYFFSEPETNAKYFKAFLTSFVNSVLAERGGDKTINDIMRVGRIPFGVNNKRLPDGKLKYPGPDGEPFECRLYQVDYSRRYTIDDITDAFGFDVQMRTETVREYEDDEMVVDFMLYELSKKILTKMDMSETPGGEVTENQSGSCRIRCVWGDEHTNGLGSRGAQLGAYIRPPRAGEAVPFLYNCSHDICRERATWANKSEGGMWEKFTDEIVMPFVYKWCNNANSPTNADKFGAAMYGSKA